jgi:GNAT superfamily N-acetyltransferase
VADSRVTARVTVRAARDDDLGAVAALLAGLQDPPTVIADVDVWRAILAQPGRALLIAEVDGAAAGTADLIVSPNLTHGGRPHALVENVVVAPSHRRDGIGRALMDDVERRARDAGCYRIQLLSANPRTEAHAFYGSCGYERSAQGFRRYL